MARILDMVVHKMTLAQDQLAHGGYYKNIGGAVARWDNGSQLFYMAAPGIPGLGVYDYKQWGPTEKVQWSILAIPFSEIVAMSEYQTNKKS